MNIYRLLIICTLTSCLVAADKGSPLAGLPGFSVDDEQISYGDIALQASDDSAEDRKRDRRRLKRKLSELREAITASELEDQQRDSILAVIADLGAADQHRSSDQMTPAFARLLVLDGWLERAVPQLERDLARMRRALGDAVEPAVVRSWQGDGVRVHRIADLWGRGGFVVMDTAQDRSWLFTRPPQPFYDNQRGLRDCWLRLRIEPRRDSKRDVLDAIEPATLTETTEAALMHGEQVLASWSEEEGFSADEKAWRKRFPVGKGPRLRERFPPHVALADLQGGVIGLAVPDGLLRPPADPSPSAGEVFLKRAAALLPSAAQLDLLGNYMVKYVYDSPDPTRPLLIGNRELKSDIHQTALETVATVTGGVCRGDCDDLSELYQDILERQGKLAHIIMLPGHAAVAFAEEVEDQWHVMVMQTGPGLEFRADDLPKALEKAYKSFDQSANFSADGLGLLLRFSGEKTRGPWRLSWRIFAEPDYAETMIGVQRDWHYQTYLQGIDKMLAMIAEGDEDTANYRELGGLYAFTGQWEKCIEYMRMASERTENPLSRIEVEAEIAGHLVSADKPEEALAKIDDILADQLPPLREQMNVGIMNFGLQLAGIAGQAGDGDKAVAILHQTALGPAVQIARQLATAIKQGLHEKKEAWMLNGQVRLMRRLVRGAMTGGLMALEAEHAENPDEQTTTQRQQTRQLIETWLAEIAMADIDEQSEVLDNYALVGRLWVLDEGLPAVLDALEAATLPADTDVDHRAVALERDRHKQVAWIALSLPFYYDLLEELCIEVDEPPERALLERIEALQVAAAERARELKLLSPMLKLRDHMSQVMLAMALEDEQRLRTLLAEVKRLDEKKTRDHTARLMGDCAPLVSDTFFDAALQAWIDEVDYKPKYYWIAWRAALAGADDKALAAAELAAERFPDDKAFVDEYIFMQELLK